MLRIRITLTTKWKLILRQKVILIINADDTSSEVGDEYESDPWAPLKVEATQQSLSEFEELTQNFTAEGFDKNEAKGKPTYLSY